METQLEHLLAESLTGRVVPKYALPTETELNSCHAQLARVTREQRSFRMVPVERTEENGTE